MKDYSKYFKGPSLKDARSRGRTEVQHLDDAFEIPADMVGIGKGQTYYIQTYGCQANERDTETLSGILEMMGYTHTDEVKQADVVLLNTCAIRENAEEKVFGKIGYLKNIKKTRPNLIFGVCGCMAQEEVVVNKILEKFPQVDLIFGTHNIHRLPELLKEAMMSKEIVVEVWSKEGDIVENVPAARENKLKAWVNIMYGCDKFCTYCIVPYTRGKQRSRLPEDILKEVKSLKEKGYKEVTLLGQNVNAYGKDLEESYTMANLLEDVAKTNIPRIRFVTSHPWDFTDDMIDIIAKYDNIMPYIHLPLQSGSTKILQKMGRKYTKEEYRELFYKIKNKIKNVSITTDIIVGFPGESKEDFQETLDLVDELKYDLAYTFIYSKREGTPAGSFKDETSLDEKKERLAELNKKINQYALENNQKYLNKIVDVLIEGESEKEGRLMGYTDTMKLVNVKAPKKYIGKIVKVKITEVKTWSLDGEVVDGK